MTRVLIVDDEKPARDELRFLLEEAGQTEIVGEGTNGIEAVALCRRLKPDLVFLDIQMPGKNGLEAAGEISRLEEPPLIIFQTAYDEFALQAFEVHAVDYLLKPISPKRLKDAIGRIKDRTSHRHSLKALLESLAGREKQIHSPLALFKGDAIIPVKQGDILFAEARGKEVRLVTRRGEFFQSKPFWQIDELLTLPDFFRCHRSYTVNLTYVEQVDLWVNNTYMIKLYGTDERIPVSRGHIGDFREKFHI